LTARAQSYGQRAICAAVEELCGSWELPYEAFVESLQQVKPKQAEMLFTYGLSWIAYIQAHGGDYTALAKLPQSEAILRRVQQLNPDYRAATVEHYLGILNTIRPPALGGNFEAGLAHFERAMELSGGHDLSIKVDFARYYARTLYERELHDRLLQEVLEADPKQRGYTLFNTLAQDTAAELLASADAYF
jgi:tetratricopeptide (TPR) repeat protein